MKRIIGTLAIVATLTVSFAFTNLNENEKLVEKATTTLSSDYCDGWEDGYCEGWKDVKGQYAICPVTPICPIAKIDCSEGYRCGYNRGFKAGMRAARND